MFLKFEDLMKYGPIKTLLASNSETQNRLIMQLDEAGVAYYAVEYKSKYYEGRSVEYFDTVEKAIEVFNKREANHGCCKHK
jgi:hypothetical protein